jgi:hypothetical protein
MPEFVNVAVPAEHVLKVYALISELEGKSLSGQDAGTIAGDVNDESWHSEDLRRLRASPWESVRRVAQVMNALAEAPHKAFSLSELSEATGLSRGELKGGFSGFTRWVKREFDHDSRGWPFEWSVGAPTHSGVQSEFYYLMEKDMAVKWSAISAGGTQETARTS